MGKKKQRDHRRASASYRALAGLVDEKGTAVLKPQPCLGCGAMLDRASPMDEGKKPHAGAITVCWTCGHVQAFDSDLNFRPLSDEETIDIAGHPEIVAVNNMRGKLIDAFKRGDKQSAMNIILASIVKDLLRSEK